MNWKRNKLSFALWVFLSVITCLTGYFVAYGFSVKYNIQGLLFWAIFAGVLLAGGLISVLFTWIKDHLLQGKKEKKSLWLGIEIVLFLGILIVGIVLRAKQLPNFTVSGDLFDAIKMKYQEGFPKYFYCVDDLYLGILHEICFFFGNMPTFYHSRRRGLVFWRSEALWNCSRHDFCRILFPDTLHDHKVPIPYGRAHDVFILWNWAACCGNLPKANKARACG